MFDIAPIEVSFSEARSLSITGLECLSDTIKIQNKHAFYYHGNSLVNFDLEKKQVCASIFHFSKRIVHPSHSAVLTFDKINGISIYNRKLKLLFQAPYLFQGVEEEQEFEKFISNPIIEVEGKNVYLIRDWPGTFCLVDSRSKKVLFRYQPKKTIIRPKKRSVFLRYFTKSMNEVIQKKIYPTFIRDMSGGSLKVYSWKKKSLSLSDLKSRTFYKKVQSFSTSNKESLSKPVWVRFDYYKQYFNAKETIQGFRGYELAKISMMDSWIPTLKNQKIPNLIISSYDPATSAFRTIKKALLPAKSGSLSSPSIYNVKVGKESVSLAIQAPYINLYRFIGEEFYFIGRFNFSTLLKSSFFAYSAEKHKLYYENNTLYILDLGAEIIQWVDVRLTNVRTSN